MVIGGFNHYDFKNVELSTVKVVIPGIYDYLESNYNTEKPFIFTGFNFDSSEEGALFFPSIYIGGISVISSAFVIPLGVSGDPSTTLNMAYVAVNDDDEVTLEYYPFPF